MIIVDLEEEQDKFVPPTTLDDATAIIIHRRFGKQLEVGFPTPLNDHQYVLRSKGYIGTIPISDGLWVRVTPRVGVANIFRMLEYAYSLRSFRFFDGITSLDSVDDIFGRLAVVLAQRVLDRVRRGLHRGYVGQRHLLPYVKGRLQTLPAFRAMECGSLKLPCDYEQHTAEVMDNHIVVWTLYQMRKLPLRGDVARLQVRKAYRAISHFVSEQMVSGRDCVGRLYDRLNDDYEPIHALCRFFLDHIGPGLEAGSYQMLPFTVSMPSLFERFVAEWLKRNLPRHLQIRTQYRRVLDAKQSYYFKIDIMLQDKATGQCCAVVDTKYKLEQRVQQGDIAQIVAYALTMNTRNAVLVYPSSQTMNMSLEIGEGMEVRSAVFDLEKDPEEAGMSFLSQLALPLGFREMAQSSTSTAASYSC